MHEARRQARAAAEQRRVLSAGSGHKLGGAPVRRGQDIRKVIADAALRRAVVTKGCASGTTSREREHEIIQRTDKNGFRTKAEEDDANEEAIMIAYIDLVQEDEKNKYGKDYVAPSKENPAGSQGARGLGASKLPTGQEPASSNSRRIPSNTKPKSLPILPNPINLAASDRHSGDTWTCEICTLINPSNHLCCGACDVERPSPPSSPSRRPLPPSTQSRPPTLRDSNTPKALKSLISLDKTMKQQPKKPLGWLCHACGNFMEEQWWTCANCGVMKQTS